MGRHKLSPAEKLERLNARKELKLAKNAIKQENDGLLLSQIVTETSGVIAKSKRGRKTKSKTACNNNSSDNQDTQTNDFFQSISNTGQISVYKNNNISSNEITVEIIKNTLPWTEKYRPKTFDDIILEKSVKNKLLNLSESGMLTNLIISGTSGTGKTTTTLCLARLLLGNRYNEYILELNASDNRGLEIINNSVIHFCKKKINMELGIKKMVIFDEADNLTNKAQNVLANMMEEFKQTTIFCFTCNDSSKLIESIQSRCLILNYRPINNDMIKQRLLHICANENINYDEYGLNAIMFIAQGDVRQAINNLEAIHNSYDMVNEENVYKLCYQPHPNTMIMMIQSCVNRNLASSIQKYNELKDLGYCNSDILQTMINVLKLISIDEHIRINYIKILSDTYLNVNDGVDTNLQMYSCISKMIKYMYDVKEL
jgi:replication factor C subunit 2/4